MSVYQNISTALPDAIAPKAREKDTNTPMIKPRKYQGIEKPRIGWWV
jgi:hypothetical protein